MRKTPRGWIQIGESRTRGVARIPLGLKPSRDSRTTSQRDSPIWIQPLGVFRYRITAVNIAISSPGIHGLACKKPEWLSPKLLDIHSKNRFWMKALLTLSGSHSINTWHTHPMFSTKESNIFHINVLVAQKVLTFVEAWDRIYIYIYLHIHIYIYI